LLKRQDEPRLWKRLATRKRKNLWPQPQKGSQGPKKHKRKELEEVGSPEAKKQALQEAQMQAEQQQTKRHEMAAFKGEVRQGDKNRNRKQPCRDVKRRHAEMPHNVS
jgi:hypothetical protein